MNLYPLHPQDFDDAHKSFVADFRRAMATLSKVSNTIVGCKDIDGRILSATDAGAHAVGLARGPDLDGMRDRDTPCDDVIRHAEGFAAVEQELVRSADRNPVRAMFSILAYTSGLTGMFGEKRALIHRRSGAVLGTTFLSHEFDIAHFMAVLPNYFRELGVGCTIERTEAYPTPDGDTLPEYEHEVAFLLSVGWNAREVAAFMAFHHPHAGLGRPDAVYRCIGRIGERMGVEGSGANLRELLIAQGMHRRAPPSLFRELVGVHVYGAGPAH